MIKIGRKGEREIERAGKSDRPIGRKSDRERGRQRSCLTSVFFNVFNGAGKHLVIMP